MDLEIQNKREEFDRRREAERQKEKKVALEDDGVMNEKMEQAMDE